MKNNYERFNQYFNVRNTWSLWVFYFFLILTAMIIQDFSRTVTPHYIDAALHWFQGQDLYDHTGTGFIYLPQAAILYTPFAWLPFTVSETLWRILSIGMLAWSVLSLASLEKQNSGNQFFSIITLVLLPIAFSSTRNGQMNLIVTALMIFTMTSLANSRDWRAAFCLVLGLALKPTMIVLVLLIGGSYKSMWWKIALGMTVMLLFPFFTQTPEYVIAQYWECIQMFKDSYTLGANLVSWSQLFGLLGTSGIVIPEATQTVLRIIAALLTLGLALKAKNKLNPAETAIVIFTLAACYLMLFNPRTENNDYMILAPAIGLYLGRAIVERSWACVTMLSLIAIGLMKSHTFAHWLAPHAQNTNWLSPLLVVFFTGFVLTKLLKTENSIKLAIPN